MLSYFFWLQQLNGWYENKQYFEFTNCIEQTNYLLFLFIFLFCSLGGEPSLPLAICQCASKQKKDVGAMPASSLPLLLLSLVLGVGDGKHGGCCVFFVKAISLQCLHHYCGVECGLKLHKAEGVHGIGVLGGFLGNYPC